MKTADFDEFDRRKLQEARKLILKVYEANYKAPGMSAKEGRLETILAKLDFLLDVSDTPFLV